MAEAPSTSVVSQTRVLVVGSVLIVVVTAAVFWGALSCGFVNYDDPMYVVENERVRAGLTWDGIAWSLSTPEAYNWHPVTWWSHMLDVSLFGLDARGHHATSLVVHAATAVVVFVAFAVATGRPVLALFVALAFALHPLRVQSVVWIAERKDLLCGLFYLLALVTHLSPSRARPAHRLALTAFAIGALASKPAAVSLPFALLIVDAWPLGRLTSLRALPALAREKAHLFVITIGVTVVTIALQRAVMQSLEERGAVERVGIAAAAALTYVAQTLTAPPLSITHDMMSEAPSTTFQIVSVVAILALCAVAAALWRRAPAVAAGVAWFLVVLAPMSGIVAVGPQFVADRYTYLPSVGLAVAVVYGLDAVVVGEQRGRAVAAASAAAVVVLAFWCARTLQEIPAWHDPQSLWTHAVQSSPRSVDAHASLSGIYVDAGRFDDAVNEARAARDLMPTAEAEDLVARRLKSAGRDDEALAQFERAHAKDPTEPRLAAHYAEALHEAGRTDDAEAVFKDGRARASTSAPPEARKRLLQPYAFLLEKRGRHDEALPLLVEALRLDPADKATMQLIDRALQARGLSVDERRARLEALVDDALSAQARP